LLQPTGRMRTTESPADGVESSATLSRSQFHQQEMEVQMDRLTNGTGNNAYNTPWDLICSLLPTGITPNSAERERT
jgi:hypothetical protein